jgi:hypothetical protein
MSKCLQVLILTKPGAQLSQSPIFIHNVMENVILMHTDTTVTKSIQA